MRNIYKLIFDSGENKLIIAYTRGEAIEKYCKETGMKKEWLDSHCIVKNLGGVVE